MNNLNKFITVLSQILGLLIGTGFRTPIEIKVKNYPEYIILK